MKDCQDCGKPLEILANADMACDANCHNIRTRKTIARLEADNEQLLWSLKNWQEYIACGEIDLLITKCEENNLQEKDDE